MSAYVNTSDSYLCASPQVRVLCCESNQAITCGEPSVFFSCLVICECRHLRVHFKDKIFLLFELWDGLQHVAHGQDRTAIRSTVLDVRRTLLTVIQQHSTCNQKRVRHIMRKAPVPFIRQHSFLSILIWMVFQVNKGAHYKLDKVILLFQAFLQELFPPT